MDTGFGLALARRHKNERKRTSINPLEGAGMVGGRTLEREIKYMLEGAGGTSSPPPRRSPLCAILNRPTQSRNDPPMKTMNIKLLYTYPCMLTSGKTCDDPLSWCRGKRGKMRTKSQGKCLFPEMYKSRIMEFNGQYQLCRRNNNTQCTKDSNLKMFAISTP